MKVLVACWDVVLSGSRRSFAAEYKIGAAHRVIDSGRSLAEAPWDLYERVHTRECVDGGVREFEVTGLTPPAGGVPGRIPPVSQRRADLDVEGSCSMNASAAYSTGVPHASAKYSRSQNRKYAHAGMRSA